MADQLQLRGGTTAEHASFTGALREITVDTDKDTVVVHDNATVGGHPLQKQYPALGSAAAPTYTFTGDTNTGIYSPGADQVAISTGGTGRLFVDGSGRVLVGVSSTSGQQTGARHVFNDGSGSAFTGVSVGNPGGGLNNTDLNITAWSGSGANYFTSKFRQIGDGSLAFHTQASSSADGAGTTTERMRLDSSGNLGLGTSTFPYATGGRTCFEVNGTSSSLLNLKYSNNPGLTITSSASANTVESNSTLPVAFYTNGSERMRLDSSGRLGLGSTTALGYKLNVYETGTGMINALHLGSGGGTAGNGASISFGLGNGFDPTANILAKIGGIYTGGGYEGALTFHSNPGSDGASPRERARIDSSGRLLVGTSSASGNNLLQVTTDALINGITVGKGASSISTNTAIGVSALNAVTTGNETIAVGHTAGASLTTGTRNVFIGYKAGNHDIGTLTTGSQCIFAGAYARPSAVGSQREHVFGYDIVGKGNSTTFIDNACYQGNNSASWTTTSDQRLKKNITDNLEGLEKINQIRVVNFEYRPEEEIEDESLRPQAIAKEGVQLGVIAQELQKVCPECVIEQSTGVLSVIDDNIFWHMVNAVKELSAQNAALEHRLAALEAS